MKKLMSLLMSVLIAAMIEMPVMADIAVTDPVEKNSFPFLAIGIVIIAAAIILFIFIRKKK